MTEAMRYKAAFERVKELVMPDVLAKAEKEKAATGKESTRWTRMANRWWQFRDYQPGTMAAISTAATLHCLRTGHQAPNLRVHLVSDTSGQHARRVPVR